MLAACELSSSRSSSLKDSRRNRAMVTVGCSFATCSLPGEVVEENKEDDEE